MLAAKEVAMPFASEERAAQYREHAAELRQLAGRSRYEENRRQLRHLAEEFDALAADVDERVTIAA
jgi:hypothetical protein